jgi:hypothetical protein
VGTDVGSVVGTEVGLGLGLVVDLLIIKIPPPTINKIMTIAIIIGINLEELLAGVGPPAELIAAGSLVTDWAGLGAGGGVTGGGGGGVG